MKKWFMGSLVATIAIASLPGDADAREIIRSATKQATTFYKHAGKVELRVIEAEEIVLIRKRGAVWTKIEYANKFGYVATKDLRFPETDQEKEAKLKVQGEALKKKTATYNRLVEKGLFDRLIGQEDLSYRLALAQFESHIQSVGVSKKAAKRLTTSYVNPGKRAIKRVKHELVAWQLMELAQTQVRNMAYDEAAVTYKKIQKELKAGKALRKKMKYPALPKTFQQKMTKRVASIQKRLKTSTFNDLLQEGHVHWMSEIQFEPITAATPYIDSNNKKHTNGFVLKQSADRAAVMISLHLPDSNIFNQQQVIFKKVRYTLSRSQGMNEELLEAPITMVLRGDKVLKTATTLEPLNEPIEKEAVISADSAIFFEFEHVPKGIAVTDIVFYR
ncbi:MAG: hypothetical protein ACI4XN_10520, partial [Candidatus Kurthia intestinigallinarum]